MKIHFLNTIWSDIIILEDDGHVAFVDTGMADEFPIIKSYLDEMGVKKIDFILLTHFHRDHYGSIPALMENYEVGKVYLKAYSALDSTMAWGGPADQFYRESERWKYDALKRLITLKSSLVMADGLKEIPFGKTVLGLFASENTIREIYEDAANPETYHQILLSENLNSLSVCFEAEGVNVFLGGDMQDVSAPHEKADFKVTKLAKAIGKQIGVYKAPHHGTAHTCEPEGLAVFRPEITIITNGERYLANSDTADNIKKANPDAEVYLTEKSHVVVELKDGHAKVLCSAGRYR